MEPELKPEGRRSLRLGVRTGGSPAFGGPGPAFCLCPPHPLACPSPPAGCVPQSARCCHHPYRSSSRKGPHPEGRGGVGVPSHSAGSPRTGLSPSTCISHGWQTTLGTAAVAMSLSAVTDSLGLGSHCHWLILWSHLTLQGGLGGWMQGPGRPWSGVGNERVPLSPARLTLAAAPELPIPHQVSPLHLADAGPGPPGPGL